MTKMTIVLADIGGTHARFAVLEKSRVCNPKKFPVADFSDMAAALQSYAGRGGRVLIATAAQPDAKQKKWRFTNNRQWVIDPASLRRAGWVVGLVVNDFAASARGVAALKGKGLEVLRKGVADKSSPRAVIGPGTGLGLAFIGVSANGSGYVQETLGGHMKAAVLTQEQQDVMEVMSRLYGDGRALVYEDVASGRALPVLYRAVCRLHGKKRKFTAVEDLLLNAADPSVKDSLRLFHEFLGLFAHNVVVTGHAFGGLYLDGGVTQRLYKAGLFDFRTFAKFMAPPVVPVVRGRLRKVPVYLVNDSFVALRGLAEMVKNDA